MEYRDAGFKQFRFPFVSPLDGTGYNGVAPPEADLTAAGYFPCVGTEKPAGDFREKWALDGGRWVQGWEAYTPDPPAEPSPVAMPDGIETPVVVLVEASTGRGYGVVAAGDGSLVTYLDHASPRPDKAERGRRIAAAVAARSDERAALLALVEALSKGGGLPADVKAAAADFLAKAAKAKGGAK